MSAEKVTLSEQEGALSEQEASLSEQETVPSKKSKKLQQKKSFVFFVKNYAQT